MMKIDKQVLSKYKNLDLFAKQVVEGFITGLHKSPFHGFSVEFAEHRLYNSGESTKHIDWKLFGRTEKLFTKRYEEETNLRCQIVIDTSSSMYYPNDSKKIKKIEFAIYAAAALTELLKKQRDAIGLSLFSTDIKLHTPAKLNMMHLQLIFSQLEQLLEKQNEMEETVLAENLHVIAETIHKRSMIALFSDFFESSSAEIEKLYGALQHLKHNKHEVILFNVVDKSTELDFEFENRPYTFIDSENGTEVKLYPNAIKAEYTKAIAERKSDIMLKCRQYGIDYVECDVADGFDKILTAYLIKRMKIKG